MLEHIRIKARSPGHNGVRERGFGALTYEHLYRHEITDGPAVAREAEAYRQVFNHVRPHESLDMARTAERYLAAVHDRPEPVSVLNQSEPENLPLS